MTSMFCRLYHLDTCIILPIWYGADEVVDRWLPGALEEAGVLNGSNSESPLKSMLESFLPGI